MNLTSKFTKKNLLIQKHRFHYMIRIFVLRTLTFMVFICHTSLSQVSYKMMELHMLLFVFQFLPHYALWNTVHYSFVSLTLSTKFHLCNSVYSLYSCNICCELYTSLSLSQSPCLNSKLCFCLTYQFIKNSPMSVSL